MKRTAIKRGRPIRRVSKRRARENAKYLKLRNQFLIDHPICQACKTDKSTQVHHKNKRYKDRLNKTEWWMATCNYCHTWIHNHPKEAYDNGFLIK